MTVPRRWDESDRSAWDEVEVAKSIETAQEKTRFWDRLYEEFYLQVLEDVWEVGRHGAIYELVRHLVPRGRILDAGCGTGILASLLDLDRYRYLGIDISAAAIARARAKSLGDNAQFRIADLSAFVDDDAADAVILNESAYYLSPESLRGFLGRNKSDAAVLILSVYDFPEGLACRRLISEMYPCLHALTIEAAGDGQKWHISVFR